jgi:hypothetical protein
MFAAHSFFRPLFTTIGSYWPVREQMLAQKSADAEIERIVEVLNEWPAASGSPVKANS